MNKNGRKRFDTTDFIIHKYIALLLTNLSIKFGKLLQIEQFLMAYQKVQK
jgi:hypothetical protein